MRKHQESRKFAAKLLAISSTDGLLDEDKIAAVLKVLPRTADALPTLHEYYRLLKRASMNEKLLIFSDREVTDDQRKTLVAHFENKLGRRLRAQSVIDPSVIAGVRVQIGDRIFEHSVCSTLGTLR